MTVYTATCAIQPSDTLTARLQGDTVRLDARRGSGGVGIPVLADPDNARTFARGILALADEIDGGEAPAAEPASLWGIKVGDRIRILKDEAEYATVEAGEVFPVTEVGRSVVVVYDEARGENWYFSQSDSLEKVTDDAPFKVGDRVVVVREYQYQTSHVDGKAGTIIRFDDGDEAYPYQVATVDHPDGVWVHEIRKVDDTPATEALKVGDKLRVLIDDTNDAEVSCGEILTVATSPDRHGEFYADDAAGTPWVFDVEDHLGISLERVADEAPAPLADPVRVALLKEAQALVDDDTVSGVNVVDVARFLAGE